MYILSTEYLFLKIVHYRPMRNPAVNTVCDTIRLMCDFQLVHITSGQQNLQS